MTPQEIANWLLQIHQANRGSPEIERLFDVFEFGQEYVDQLDQVRGEMSEDKMDTNEQEAFYAHMVRHFEQDLLPEERLDMIMSCLDVLIEQAHAGKFDKESAKQIHTRANHIYSAVTLPKLVGAA